MNKLIIIDNLTYKAFDSPALLEYLKEFRETLEREASGYSITYLKQTCMDLLSLIPFKDLRKGLEHDLKINNGYGLASILFNYLNKTINRLELK